MRRFDEHAQGLLDAQREVDIETNRPDDTPQRATIWVVVDDGDVFVRSWLGDRARWFQAAIDRPDEVALLADGRRLEVRVVAATDDRSVARCSSAIERKYAGQAETPAMLREAILGTTLRLEPREGP